MEALRRSNAAMRELIGLNHRGLDKRLSVYEVGYQIKYRISQTGFEWKSYSRTLLAYGDALVAVEITKQDAIKSWSEHTSEDGVVTRRKSMGFALNSVRCVAMIDPF